VAGLGPGLTGLDLSGNELTGFLPAALCNLTGLHLLYLQDNELSGPVPDCIGGLTELTALDLSGNSFSGPIPATLANPTGLEWLLMGSNELSGPFPTELCSLAALRYLQLGGNRISGTIPDCIGNLTALVHLDLGDNGLEGTIPHTIGNLSQLQWASFAGNRMAGALPTELTFLGSLVQIFVNYNALFSENPLLGAFLDARNPGWRDSQTLAPLNLNDTSRTACSVVLEWNRVSYTVDPGGYWAWYATEPDGPYTRYPVPSNSKYNTSLRVTGLGSLSTYYFKVSTYTGAHAHNRNLVESLPGEVLAATTGIAGGNLYDMDGDPAPAHTDLFAYLRFFFDDAPLTSADCNCDGVADAVDLAQLLAAVSP